MKLDKSKVAYWYKYGLWTDKMVQDAVKKGKLTAEEADEILLNDTKVII